MTAALSDIGKGSHVHLTSGRRRNGHSTEDSLQADMETERAKQENGAIKEVISTAHRRKFEESRRSDEKATTAGGLKTIRGFEMQAVGSVIQMPFQGSVKARTRDRPRCLYNNNVRARYVPFRLCRQAAEKTQKTAIINKVPSRLLR